FVISLPMVVNLGLLHKFTTGDETSVLSLLHFIQFFCRSVVKKNIKSIYKTEEMVKNGNYELIITVKTPVSQVVSSEVV
ncbi:MAG TPA: hypothetical protein PKV61_06325, partial [Bacteroidales bacterium]|nr:hypothetical protein [Bacteroidales bacterium]